jgi:hypothetical protein
MPLSTIFQLYCGGTSLNFCLEILGELDDQLAPIGKELFSMEEDDNSEWDDEDLMGEARPGTTKRKQYYLKKVPFTVIIFLHRK